MILKLCIALVALTAALSGLARAEPLKAAVFDLELIDTSLEGEMLGRNDAETKRLAMLGERLRTALDASETFDLVDIAPVVEAARKSSLQSCGGCDSRFARELGADVAITGTVQKVSNLILNINLYVRDAGTGQLLGGGSADIRSNSDDSWQRGLDWLLEHRILAGERAL